jgi:probable non-F420 flavinoid oxidoreductase
MCSDHLFPWGKNQAHSGFAWSWLGAALHAAAPLPFGVVNAPGYRYNPVIIAQAAATLAEMFPDRFWVAIGSGEAMNEHITGEPWPPKAERNARLKECAEIMRALWAGEMVTHRGLVNVVEARVYSLPKNPPRLVGAAITPETAAWMAPWVDALITALQPPEALKKVVAAFRENGGEGKKLILQEKIAYAPTDELAISEAHEQWGTNIFRSGPLAQLTLPQHFDAVAEYVRPEDVAAKVHCTSNLEQHADWIIKDLQLGFDEVYIHNVTLRQTEFIDAFGSNVIPAIRRELTGE